MTTSAAQRKHMILGQIYTNEVNDMRILQALADIPREPFAPESLRAAAYADSELDLGNGRGLMAPLTFTRLLQLAEITPSCRVLNIGCATGYSAAILSRLAAQVTATDTDTAMLTQARNAIDRSGARNVQLQQVSSLAEGYAQNAPYDAIIIQGAIDYLPDAVASQLAEGGRLVTVLRNAAHPAMKSVYGRALLVRRLDNRLQHRDQFETAAMLLPGFERNAGFSF